MIKLSKTLMSKLTTFMIRYFQSHWIYLYTIVYIYFYFHKYNSTWNKILIRESYIIRVIIIKSYVRYQTKLL